MGRNPAGLKAMKELEKIEEMRRKEKSTVRAVPKGTASNEMCTFLVMNISSLQLIPVNIIAYRSQYHSVSAAAVTGPCLVATMVSTLAAVFFCRTMDRSNKKKETYFNVSFCLTACSLHNRPVYLHTFWHLLQTEPFQHCQYNLPPKQSQEPGERSLLPYLPV